MTQRYLGHGHHGPKKAWAGATPWPRRGRVYGAKNIWPYRVVFGRKYLAIPKRKPFGHTQKWQPTHKKRGYGQMACDSVWPNIFARKMGRKWATNIWPYRVSGTQKFGHTGCLWRLIMRASGHEASNARPCRIQH